MNIRAVRSFLLLSLVLLTICGTPNATAATAVQRLRISVGEYIVGGGTGNSGEPPKSGHPSVYGGSSGNVTSTHGGAHGGTSGGGTGGTSPGVVSVPAYCVDEGRHTPSPKDRFTGVAGDAKVEKLEGDTVVATRTLAAAVHGPNPWLIITGNDTYRSVDIRPVRPTDRFRLTVTGTAILGTAQPEVTATLNAWDGNTDLKRISDELDQKELTLLKAFGGDSRILSMVRDERQSWEWDTIGPIADGPQLKKVRVHGDAATLIRSWLNVDSQNVPDPDERLFRLAILEPKLLNASTAPSMASALSQIGITTPKLDPADRRALRAQVLLVRYRDAGDPFFAFAAIKKFRELRGMHMNTHDAIASLLYSSLPEEFWTTGDPTFLPTELPSSLVQAILDARHIPEQNRKILHVMASSDGTTRVYNNMTHKVSTFAHSQLTQLRALARSSGATVVYDGPDTKRLLTGLNIQAVDSRDYINQRESSMFISSMRKMPDGSQEFALRHAFRDENTPGLDVTFLKLSGKGDSIVVRAPDGSVILVDTGLTRELIPKLRAEFGGSIPPIRLVITHTDADHIKGLATLIKDKTIRLEEVLVGRYDGDMTKTATVILTDLTTVAGLRRRPSNAPGITHFIAKDGVAPLFSVASENDGTINRWTLTALGQLQLYVYHMDGARAPNDGGLVVQLKYRGMSEFLTDDISSRVLHALVYSSFGDSLHSGILKWPHHVWFPPESRKKDRNILREFLEAVDPHTIIFSNMGAASHLGNWLKVRQFVRKVLGRSMKCIWTLDSRYPANIRIMTDNMTMLPQPRAA